MHKKRKMQRKRVRWRKASLHDKVPFSVPWITRKDKKAALAALSSRWLTGGPLISKFETLFADYLDTNYAVAVSNCTAALHIVMRALGVHEDDEVIVPALTFAATANSVLYCGARPVLSEVDPVSFNMSPSDMERRITPRTKGIIVVHYAGLACEMDRIMEVAERRKLFVVEDCAHSLGADYGSRKTGTFGVASCFSFYPTKNITTIEGGMVATDDEGIARKASLLRSHCMTRTALEREQGGEWFYDIVDLGYNYRLNEVQAALGISQLARLDEANQRRITAANYYRERLEKLKGIICPPLNRGKHVFHLYTIRIEKERFGLGRDELFRYLSSKGIEPSVHYTPLHLLSLYKERLGYELGDFPVAEQLGREVLSLPLFPTITRRQIDYVCDSIEEAPSHSGR